MKYEGSNPTAEKLTIEEVRNRLNNRKRFNWIEATQRAFDQPVGPPDIPSLDIVFERTQVETTKLP